MTDLSSFLNGVRLKLQRSGPCGHALAYPEDEKRTDLKLLLEIVEEQRKALDEIGKVNHPSVADKASWIVMCESICKLARDTQERISSMLREAGR